MRDQHCHTIYSPDASKESTFEAYIASAEKKGLSHLTFTDHVDYEANAKIFDQIPDFTAFENALKAVQKNTNVKLQMGVELGYQPHVLDRMNALVGAHDFDLVILSVHYVRGLDPYDGSLFEGRSLDDALTLYFKTVLEAIQVFDDFQILAHIDYVFRYLDHGIEGLNMDHFIHILDAIFKTLIKKNKVLEVNTAPYRKPYAVSEPVYALIKRYYDVGGRLISLGSDAHHPDDLIADFHQAAKKLQTLGFQEVVFIESRAHKRLALNTFL